MARLPSDHASRLAATDPSRSFIIQAPAGSGKTELLTDRILALLATVNRPEEILAITFTRKAAAEMHARVLEKLEAGLGPAPAEAHRRRSWELARAALERDEQADWKLLQYPARLSIRTIDAFCAWLVRGMPLLSELGGMPLIAEDAGIHYEWAAQATLDMADEHACVARLIEHVDVDLQTARDLLAGMLGQRDQWMPLLVQGSDAGLLEEALRESVEEELEILAAAMPPGWSQALGPCVSHAAGLLREQGAKLDLQALCDWDGDEFGSTHDELPRWQALARLLLTGTGSLRARVTRNEGFERNSPTKDAFVQWLAQADPQAPWIPLLDAVRAAPPGGYDGGQLDILAALIDTLWLAAGQLHVRFAQAREVDFIEIAQRAARALGRIDDPSDLLLALDTTIHHVLVDEFQDTSQAQIELLQRLTSGWQQGDGRTLFLVGDPMQSIYRFRKAEVGWFFRVQDEGLGDVALTSLKLSENFRSQAGVVQWVNQTFRSLFPREVDADLGAIPYAEAVPFHEGLGGEAVRLHPLWQAGTGEQGAPDMAALEEDKAIELAREALETDAHSEHPVAILVRARPHLGRLVHRLAQEGLPCRALELVSLKQRQVVVDLVQLARALSHPGDRLAWLAVLRSPLCGLTLRSLHAVCGHDHGATVPELLQAWLQDEAAARPALEPAEARRLRQAAEVLVAPGNVSGVLPFAAHLQQIWEQLGGPRFYSSPGDVQDAERLFREIEQLAPYGGLNPAELDARLERLYAAPNSTGRAIEVMTIHKAKGLEFGTVILMGLHRPPRSDIPPLIRFEHSGGRLLLGPIKERTQEENDPVSVYLARREKQRARHETDRLLYVAATRARSRLHLVAVLGLDGAGNIRRPAGTCLLGRLWDHMRTPEPPGAGLPDQSDDPNAKGDRAGRLLVRPAVPRVPAAVRGAPVESSRTWHWPEDARHDAAAGTIAHAWLERIGRDGLHRWPSERIAGAADLIELQLSRAGVPGAHLHDAVEVVRDTLLAAVSSSRGRGLLGAAGALREWSLLETDGRVSVIDLAIQGETGWLVVDYKTGIPAAGESMEAFHARMSERHAAQLQRYCEQVHALHGTPVRGALYFPRADAWIPCWPSLSDTC